jgi:hypothetical protein
MEWSCAVLAIVFPSILVYGSKRQLCSLRRVDVPVLPSRQTACLAITTIVHSKVELDNPPLDLLVPLKMPRSNRLH